MTRPCRVPGCTGTDRSYMDLCDTHFRSLPLQLRHELVHAVTKSRGMGDKLRSQILGPVILKALAHIEAAATNQSLFGEEI